MVTAFLGFGPLVRASELGLHSPYQLGHFTAQHGAPAIPCPEDPGPGLWEHSQPPAQSSAPTLLPWTV